ncbi:MAG TPA: protease inhibitor I9 family protein, partial [Gaiellaceae bacterium]
MVVTLKAPAAGRSLQSARRLEAVQAQVTRSLASALPAARVRWHYRHVLDGLSVVLPANEVGALKRVAGVAEVWPNVRYHSLAARLGPQQIGADKLWGPNFDTAGNGMKIGIIDDGVDAS